MMRIVEATSDPAGPVMALYQKMHVMPRDRRVAASVFIDRASLDIDVTRAFDRDSRAVDGQLRSLEYDLSAALQHDHGAAAFQRQFAGRVDDDLGVSVERHIAPGAEIDLARRGCRIIRAGLHTDVCCGGL